MVVLPTVILELSISTVQYNIYSCHECYCFLWSSDVESLIILQSVECFKKTDICNQSVTITHCYITYFRPCTMIDSI